MDRRSLPYGAGGSEQPRVDRDLLRFLWCEDCARLNSNQTYGAWRAQKIQLMDVERALTTQQQAERDAAEKEAERLEKGPWAAAEYEE